MAKMDYNKISKEAKEQKTVIKPEETTKVVEEPVEVTAKVVDEPIETKETKNESKTVKGIVTNCTGLKVRMSPAVKPNNAFSVIDAGVEIDINLDESTKDWYKITTKGGITGFCMKDFITIK